MRLVIVDRTLDVAVTSLTMLAAAGLALLTIPRYQESGRLSLLLQASAFVLSATFSGLTVVLVLSKLDAQLGMTLGMPEQLPLYVTAITRLVIGVLFLAGGPRGRAPHPLPGRASAERAAGTRALIIVGLTIVAYPLARPAGCHSSTRRASGSLVSDTAGAGRLEGITPLAIGAVVVTRCWCSWPPRSCSGSATSSGARASDGYPRRRPRHHGLRGAPGGVLPQRLHGPRDHVGHDAAAGVRRAAAGHRRRATGGPAGPAAGVHGARPAAGHGGGARGARGTRRGSRARSTTDWRSISGSPSSSSSGSPPSVPDEDRPLAGEVGQALDAAIVEARQALVTMRTSLDADLPLSEMLTRTVDDFGQRSGLRVTFSAAAGLPTALPPRQQIELLRIVQEALTNVRKHADATVTRVRADIQGRDMTVADLGQRPRLRPGHRQRPGPRPPGHGGTGAAAGRHAADHVGAAGRHDHRGDRAAPGAGMAADARVHALAADPWLATRSTGDAHRTRPPTAPSASASITDRHVRGR